MAGWWPSDLLRRPWRPEAAGLAIGILASLQLAVLGSPWYITGPETQFGGWLYDRLTGGLLQVERWDYFDPASPAFVAPAAAPWDPRNAGFTLVVGFMLGAMAAKALEGNWRLRWPANRAVLVLSAAGGLMLGFGARLALGCNIGNFFATVQSLVASGLVFFLGMALGSFVATRLVEEVLAERLAASRPMRIRLGSRVDNRLVLAAALGAAAAIGLYWWHAGVAAGVLFLLFGMGYGFAGSKGNICFTSMLRDGFWSRLAPYGGNARAVAIALSIAITANLALKAAGLQYREFLFPVGIHTFLGGVLFGFGMVLVAGCSFSSAYRAGEGSIPHLVAWLSMITGMVALAYLWPFFYATSVALSPAIRLEDLLGSRAAAAALCYGLCAFIALVGSLRDGSLRWAPRRGAPPP